MNETALILIIEDDPDDSFLLERALRKAGITNPLLVADNLNGALCHLAAVNEKKTPVFVIINIGMFLSAGAALIRWIREEQDLRDVPIVAIGNSDNASDIQKAYDLGANAYFAKRLNTNELANLIRELQFLDSVLVQSAKKT